MFVISSEDGNFSLHLVGKGILSSNIFPGSVNYMDGSAAQSIYSFFRGLICEGIASLYAFTLSEHKK